MIKKSIIIGFGLIALMFFTLGSKAAPEDGITYEYKNGIATITTGNITVSVNAFGNVPIFHLQTVDGFQYTVLFKQIIEYQDLNGDGAFQYNETLAGVPILTMTSMKWVFSGFVTEEDNGIIVAIHFNFTSEPMLGIYTDFEM
ncbi:MAG: hypothetical protein ACTSSG_10985, partial [Candidatus Heimdallarchaeaceae archaeon]